jgi:flagellar M-ring protein FliF
MGALQKLIAQVVSRLRDTNVSQRIALLLGGALVAVSLIWLVQWTASPEMVPLLEQDLSAEDIALVRSGLEAMNEPFEVRGNRVLVRSSANRQALYAQLQQQEKLPADTSAGFAALIKESNPWISMEESNRRWTYALQQALEQVLRQFNGVKSANVFLNLGTQRKSFTKQPPPSSASVNLLMKSGQEVSRPLALAAARLVAGAVAGLPVHNVEVLDGTTGRVALDWEGEQDLATQLDRKLAKEELRYAQKIRQQVPDPKALVSVQVELNLTASNTQTEQPLKGVAKTERSTREESTRARQSEQPGVQPNVGIAAGASGLTETESQETSETETEVGISKKVEATPAGDVQKVTAAISLSHTYLEGVFRRTSPVVAAGASPGRPTGRAGARAATPARELEAPNDAQIEEVFQRERVRLLSQVVQLVKPQAEDNVAISWYYDSAGEPLWAGPSGTLDQAWDLMRNYGPQSGLALLALVSLGLMLRLARKSDVGEAFGLELGLPKEAIAAAKKAAADVSALVTRPGYARAARRSVAATAAGPADRLAEADLAAPIEQTSATEGMLVAQEVDAGTVQTRKMLEQVQEMVDSDADVVAALLEQWVQRNEQYRDEMS